MILTLSSVAAPLHSCVTPTCFVCGRQRVLGNVAKVLLRGSKRGAYHGVIRDITQLLLLRLATNVSSCDVVTYSCPPRCAPAQSDSESDSAHGQAFDSVRFSWVCKTTSCTLSHRDSFRIGIMGEACARNLLKLGHGVCVWNRNADKCSALVKEGAVRCETAAEVVARCDITFGMLSDPPAALSVALGPKGVLESISGKRRVLHTTIISTADALLLSCLKRLQLHRYEHSGLRNGTRLCGFES